jgi:uncharacterized protein
MPRPRTGKALSVAERMRGYRARRRAAGLRVRAKWTPRHARDVVLAHADLVRTLAKAHGATSIELFGSAARGEETDASDLDFLVELEPGRSLLDLIGLSQDLQALFGRRVEAFSRAGLKPRVLQRARKEAIRIV